MVAAVSDPRNEGKLPGSLKGSHVLVSSAVGKPDQTIPNLNTNKHTNKLHSSDILTFKDMNEGERRPARCNNHNQHAVEWNVLEGFTLRSSFYTGRLDLQGSQGPTAVRGTTRAGMHVYSFQWVSIKNPHAASERQGTTVMFNLENYQYVNTIYFFKNNYQ